MTTKSHQRAYRIGAEHHDHLRTIAKAEGRSVSDVLRTAVAQFLSNRSLLKAGDLRHHRISEYSQIAIDAIITQQYPELRSRILAETDRRMEKYHAR